MPSFCASFGPSIVTRRPSHSIVPSFAGSTPEMTFTSVDLPAPLSPTSATTSFGATSISASVRACTAPKRFEIPRSERTGAAVAVAVTALPFQVEDRGRRTDHPRSRSLLESGLLAIVRVLLRADLLDRVEAVLDHGVLDVVLGHRDRGEQLRGHVRAPVVLRLVGRGVLLALERGDGHSGGDVGLRLDRLVDRHRLVAGDDPLDAVDLRILAGERRERAEAGVLDRGRDTGRHAVVGRVEADDLVLAD